MSLTSITVAILGMADRGFGARIGREKNRPYSFHSPASSTGSNHGTVSTDTTRSTNFDPRRDDAEMSTLPVSAGLAQKLPALRETASKYDRFRRISPQHTWDINTSQIGKAFPEFSDAENSQSLSIETSRAAPPVKHFTQQENRKSSIVHKVDVVENVRNQTRSPKHPSPYISNASRLANLQPQVTEDSENSFMGLSARKSSNAALFGKQNLSVVQTTETSDISFMGASAKQPNAAFPAKYNVPGQTNRRAPNVSSKRHRFDQHPTPGTLLSKSHLDEPPTPCPATDPSRRRSLSNTQTTTATNTRAVSATTTAATTATNPTSQSFFFPGVPGENSDGSGTTLTNGLPNFSQAGKAHDRHALKASLYNANYGPVDSIIVPDDEEDIYQLIDALKKRIFRSESQNETYESQIKTQQQQIDLLQIQLAQEKESKEVLEKKQRESEQNAASIQALNIDLERELTTTMKHVASLEKENQYMAQIEQQYQQATQDNKSLNRQNSDLVQKESQYISEIEQYHQQSTILRRQNSDLVQKFNRIKEENEELRQNSDNAQNYNSAKGSNQELRQALQEIKAKTSAVEKAPAIVVEDPSDNFDVSTNVKQQNANVQKAHLEPPSRQSDVTHHTNISTSRQNNVSRHTDVTHHTNFTRNITRHTTQMSGLSMGDFSEQPTVSSRMNIPQPPATGNGEADVTEDVEITGSAFILDDIKNSYEEEATVRPSEPPFDALQRLRNNAKSTLVSLVKEHNTLFDSYSNLDPSMQRRNHKRHEEDLKKITARIQEVKEELYSLKDVKYGVKA